MRDITGALAQWLESGGRQIGQILIRSTSDGLELRHVEDAHRDDLTLHAGPEAGRVLANLDDAGAFRPLKTAPNLAHGWRLTLGSLAELRRALDYFYPAMLGCAVSFSREELPAVDLRATLGRQTGMYRITQKISDEGARATIDRFCAGCLKHRLWEIDRPNPAPAPASDSDWPLLCQESCNLLVAEIRKVVKQQ